MIGFRMIACEKCKQVISCDAGMTTKELKIRLVKECKCNKKKSL